MAIHFIVYIRDKVSNSPYIMFGCFKLVEFFLTASVCYLKNLLRVSFLSSSLMHILKCILTEYQLLRHIEHLNHSLKLIISTAGIFSSLSTWYRIAIYHSLLSTFKIYYIAIYVLNRDPSVHLNSSHHKANSLVSTLIDTKLQGCQSHPGYLGFKGTFLWIKWLI